MSIEILGPEYVFILTAWWVGVLLLALAVGRLRRVLARHPGATFASVTDDAPSA